MGLISRVSSRTYRKSDIMSMNVRTRKYMTNRLLNRKQMIVDISHGEDATPSAKKVRESLAKMYKSTPDCVIVYGMQTKFGGGSTSGFANIYDSLDYLKKNEVRFRQVRAGICERIEKKARAQRRQLKNRQKKVKGTAKGRSVPPVRSKLSVLLSPRLLFF